VNTETSLTERWLWLTISLGIAILAIGIRQVSDLLDKQAKSEPMKHRALFDIPWIIQSLRMIYAVGIPAVALLWRGTFTERWLGLKPMPWASDASSQLPATHWESWFKDIGIAVGIGFAAWLILAWGEREANQKANAPLIVQHSFGIALREAVYHQVHWAFYREPFVLLWGLNIGAWAGIIPVVIEAGLNPERWLDFNSLPRGRNLLLRTGMAIVSIILYLQTQNLWLAILVDTALGWTLGRANPSNQPIMSAQIP